MYCDPLDIPDEVIAAQEAGDLVIFAGAGISCGGASRLPLFSDLTDEIGREIQKSRDPQRRDFDVVLGEWHEAQGGLVHKAARRIIGNTETQPNDIHRLLLGLFKKPEQVRIVTTNFDRHFSTAAAILHPELPHYRAPALPLGDDFHGIVYLHGSVDDKPERLVLTDADFGRAYLSQGWARSFLQALYSRFHVLFVGFSHEDTLLTYLARGLPAHNRRRRHAFQVKGNYTRWKQLGIDIIPYARTEGAEPHENLTRGIRCWSETISLRPQDVRDRIRSIVDAVEAPIVVVGSEGAPSAIQLGRDREDFLRRALSERSSLGWFLERARDLRWIRWLLGTGILPSIAVESSSAVDPQSREVASMLVYWAASRLLRSHETEALSLFVALGGTLGATARRAVMLALLAKDAPEAWDSPHLEHWLVALRLGCGSKQDLPFLHSLIGKLVEKGKPDHAVALFALLLQVSVEWVQPWSLQDRSSIGAKPKLASEIYELKEAWDALQSLHSPAVDEKLFCLLVTTFGNVYAARGPDLDGVDLITSVRIHLDEPRETDDLRDPVEFLVDMLLAVIKSRAEAGECLGEAQILRWLGAPQPGWQRLAYFALGVDRSISAARKAEIVITRGLIYPTTWQLHHDPSDLVASIYAQADCAIKKRLLEAIISGPHLPERPADTPEGVLTKEEEELRNQFLHRVAAVHRTDPDLADALLRLRLVLPEEAEPVGDANEEEGFGLLRDLDRSPKTADELLKQTPETQIEYFLSYQGHGMQWAGCNRGGLLGAVVAAANTDVAWARGLIEVLISRGYTTGDLWDRLLWGLTWHTKDADFRRWLLIDVMPKIDPTGWDQSVWNGWTHHLFRLGDSVTFERLAQEEWDSLLAWSLTAWTATRSAVSSVSSIAINKQILDRAINHPVGRIVEFWIMYLDHVRRSDSTAPYEWPESLQNAVTELTSADGEIHLLGMAILGQYLSFLRYAVPSWTRQEIYPRMVVTEYPRASLALWSAWLCYGRLSADLAKEMPTLIEQSRGQLLACEKDVSNRVLSYTAAIAAGPFPPTNVSAWTRTILASASSAQRGWWNKEVARCMREQPADRQRAVWDLWAREYMRACGLCPWGVPSADEFSGFLHWPIAFSAAGDEALSLLKELPVYHLQRFDALHDLERSNLAEQRPDFAARYLRWLFETVISDAFGAFWLKEIFSQMRVVPENRADLEALAQRLLILDHAIGDTLLAKLQEGLANGSEAAITAAAPLPG